MTTWGCAWCGARIPFGTDHLCEAAEDDPATFPHGPLTAAQARYLADIRERPGRTYNGRARAVLIVLRDAGLIRYEMDLRGVGTGRASERYTCWPV